MRNCTWTKGLVLGLTFLFIGSTITSASHFFINKNPIPSPYRGNWLYVGGSGAGNYSSIQNAISNASSGDTIFVFSGIYFENLDIDKSIDLIGEDKNTTIIDGRCLGDVIFTFALNSLNISNFTLRNGSSHNGINCQYSWHFRIYNNFIFNCSTGIIFSSPPSNFNDVCYNTIKNCSTGVFLSWGTSNQIHNNTIEWNNVGVSLNNQYYGSEKLLNNKIINNTIGVYSSSDSPLIQGNEIINNAMYGICCERWISVHQIISNTISYNGEGIHISMSQFFINDNLIVNNINWGIHIIYLEPDITGTNIIYNNYFDNQNNAYDNGTSTTWNTTLILGENIIGGSYIGGNYWSDYDGLDNNHDGLGDTPYNILGGANQDLLPLMPLPLFVCVDDDFNSSTTGWGYDHFNQIQLGINNVSENGTVYVYNGEYLEQINILKPISLEGQNNTNTIVVGGFNVLADNVTIKLFNITCGYEWDPDDIGLNGVYRAGIRSFNSYNKFTKNTIYNIKGGNGIVGYGNGMGGTGVGISLNSSEGSIITQNNIFNIVGGNGSDGNYFGGKGGAGLGISLQSSSGNIINNNNIFNIAGGFGTSYSEYGGGFLGGDVNGFYIHSSNSNNISSNNIYRLLAGRGGNHSRGGGSGGSGNAFYIDSSIGGILTNNSIYDITGGTGGHGDWFGGVGGKVCAYYLSSSSKFNIITNSIFRLTAGNGGGNNGNGFPGSSGGVAYIFYLILSNECNIIENNISNIKGGNGSDTSSDPSVFAGDGGICYGFFLQSSQMNNISNNNIFNLSAGNGGFGGYGSNGGNGGNSIGVFLLLSNSCNMLSNIISNITAGNGGSTEEFYNSVGGDGGWSVGANLKNSPDNNISYQIISGLVSGMGGNGINNGDDGAEVGVYFINSSANMVTHCYLFGNEYGVLLNLSYNNFYYHNNIINNTINAQDDGTNTWYNTELFNGNYWSDYTGNDTNEDGIGDTPYNISGGNNQDLYPLVTSFGPPHADFIYSINDKFLVFNASFSYDYDGMITNYNWEFGDGTNGTGMIVNHLYPEYGTYPVSLTIIDNEGDSNTTTIYISLVDLILPEIWNIQDNPDPQHVGYPVNISCFVMDNVEISSVKVHLTYPDLSTTNQTMNYNPTTYIAYLNSIYSMEGGYDYFIWANDTNGNTNISSVFHFIIFDMPGVPPSNPIPADGAIGINTNVDLLWQSHDPDDTLTFDVYFGTSNPPPKVANNITSHTYNPGTLAYNTTYYWKIIAWSPHGDSMIGPLWHFTTRQQNPPNAPLINGPTSGNVGEVYTYTYVAVDPEDDNVFYEINWGDGQIDDWYGPSGSDVVITRSHTWDEKGTYLIQARAKDVYDANGPWGTLSVTMPMDQISGYQPSQQIISFQLKNNVMT